MATASSSNSVINGSRTNKRHRDDDTDNDNAISNDTCMIPCEVCGAAVTVADWESHARTHSSLSSNQADVVAASSHQAKRVRVQFDASSSSSSSAAAAAAAAASSASANDNKHEEQDSKRSQEADNNDDNGDDTVTIPCDICGARITFTGYDAHVASAHSSSASSSSSSSSSSSRSSSSPVLAQVVAGVPHRAQASRQHDAASLPPFSLSDGTIARGVSLIPCEYRGCGLSIPVTEYTDHIAAHSASSSSPSSSSSANRSVVNSSVSSSGSNSNGHHRDSSDTSDALRVLQNKEGLTTGAYQQQYLKTLDYRYRKGEITISELNDSRAAVHSITEGADPHRVMGLLPAIRTAFQSRRDLSLRLCDDFAFYYRSGGDGGWGCGLKNTQTLCSSLLYHGQMKAAMFDGSGHIPSIPVLQAQIDYAHAQGYDRTGGMQLGKLVGTSKWIGAMDVAALLRSYGIQAKVVNFIIDPKSNPDHASLLSWCWDFYAPNAHVINSGNRHNGAAASSSSMAGAASSARNSTSNVLTGRSNNGSGATISSYFFASTKPAVTSSGAVATTPTPIPSCAASASSSRRICPPIYFQHEGHSRTIIGAAMNTRTSKIELIVLDPDLTGGAVNLLSDLRDDKKWRRISRSLRELNAKAYQLTVVDSSVIVDVHTRQSLKTIHVENGVRVRRPPASSSSATAAARSSSSSVAPSKRPASAASSLSSLSSLASTARR